MQTFDDADGRTWQIRLTIGRAADLRDAGFDLVDDDARAAIFDDPLRVYAIALKLLEQQAKELGLDADGLDESLTGAFPAFFEAFVEELATFCRHLGKTAQAEIHRAILTATRKAEQTAVNKLNGVDIPGLIDRELDRASRTIDLELSRLSGGTSGEPLPSPELTRVP